MGVDEYPSAVGRAEGGRGGRPVGAITRGTTNPNRLRRVDRYVAGPLRATLLAAGERPVVVDLGFGATPVTSVELHDRLLRLRPDARAVGLELDPARGAGAAPDDEEHHARDLSGYYRALSVHPHHNYYFGRSEADLTPWLEYKDC